MNARVLRRLVVYLILQAVLPSPGTQALAGERSEAIEVRRGLLTAVIVESPLRGLLPAIARQGRVQIFLHASTDEKVTATFRDVPVEEALRRILSTTDSVFIYSQRSSDLTGAPHLQLTEVHVYAGSRTPKSPVPGALSEAPMTLASDATKTLVDPDRPRVLRKRAAQTLGRLGNQNVIGPLSTALSQDDDDTVRLNVVRALGKLRSEQAVAPLADALLADSDAEIREAAADGLAMTSPAAVDPLARALHQDSSARVREAAARALGSTSNEAALDPLVQALSSDSSPRVRESAARALGVIGDSRAVSAVANALSDGHRWVRDEAAEVLAALLKR